MTDKTTKLELSYKEATDVIEMSTPKQINQNHKNQLCAALGVDSLSVTNDPRHRYTKPSKSAPRFYWKLVKWSIGNHTAMACMSIKLKRSLIPYRFPLSLFLPSEEFWEEDYEAGMQELQAAIESSKEHITKQINNCKHKQECLNHGVSIPEDCLEYKCLRVQCRLYQDVQDDHHLTI